MTTRTNDTAADETRYPKNTKRVKTNPLVSVIVPVHNAMPFLNEAMESVLTQTYAPVEVSIYDDASVDGSSEAIKVWKEKFEKHGVKCVVSGGGEEGDTKAIGAGAARNRCVAQSTGEYLCILDADDVMMPERIALQVDVASTNRDAIVGSGFVRSPKGSTAHYTNWANSLSDRDVRLQQYRELTIIQPTWFFHRDVFDRVGGYVEHAKDAPTFAKKGMNRALPDQTPSDLYFFHRHLDLKGKLLRVKRELVMYRYLPNSVSSRIPRRQLLRVRLPPFERRVLAKWTSFTIWGAGRDGRNFFNDLSDENQKKVTSFCDIDPKKIANGVYDQRGRRHVPVTHFSDAKPPLVICVSMGRTGGALEQNVRSLGLTEGVDYWHFI